MKIALFYGGWMLTAGSGMLGARYGMLGADYFVLGTGFEKLDAKMASKISNQEVFSFFFDHLAFAILIALLRLSSLANAPWCKRITKTKFCVLS
ncbi:MAG: hypothetical protein ACLQAH_13745 [Limisphaerales bacterium]